jgi:hypothetical protein
MNIPDNFSESLETVFRVKNTYIFLCGSGIRNLFDPGSGIRYGKIQILDQHPGSATLPEITTASPGPKRQSPQQYNEEQGRESQ